MLIAALARRVHDVGLAEDLAQDALGAALETWPRTGVPDNPAAWLMTTARRRAIDHLRRGQRLEQKHAHLGSDLDEQRDLAAAERAAALDREIDEPIGDELLRLLFIACHPVLATEARVALTLRMLGGLTTPEIARAFLVPEPTLAQRIVRAKKQLAGANVPFELPPPPELTERLSSVLEVIYLVFNEGYSATAGDDWMRPGLCEDALPLGGARIRVRSGSWAGDHGRAPARAVPAQLSPAAERARRLPVEARTPRRGAGGVRACGLAHAERTRADAAARACGRVRAGGGEREVVTPAIPSQGP